MPGIQETTNNQNDLNHNNAPIESIIDEDWSSQENFVHFLSRKYPEEIPGLLKKYPKEQHYYLMTFHHKAPRSPLNILYDKPENHSYVAEVLKSFSPQERLRFIRDKHPGTKIFSRTNKSQYKHINAIIACDIYQEHLENSLAGDGIFTPSEAYITLTRQKIEAIKTARTILENNPDSSETMKNFHQKMHDNKALLETSRDTHLTYFLKCIGVIFSIGLAYHALFSNTHGKALLDTTGTSEAYKASETSETPGIKK